MNNSRPQSPGFTDPARAHELFGETLKRICRVEVRRGAEYELGTGILVAKDVVLTCYHVLRSVIEKDIQPQDVTFRFEYQMQKDRPVPSTGQEYYLRSDNWLVDFAPNSLADDPSCEGLPKPDELDYVLVRIVDQAGNPPQRGYTALPTSASPLEKATLLTVIQHPDGDPVKASQGRFLGFNENITRLRHDASTSEGSSGAPCFDDEFNLIAIHQGLDHNEPEQHKLAIPAYSITQRLKRGKLDQLEKAPRQALPRNVFEGLIYGLSAPQQVRNLLEYYVGTPQSPAPFGGRDDKLRFLDDWLHDPDAHPYLALVAKAGLGKSALLAHWVTRLAASSDHNFDIVYFPISARYGTNLESTIFSSLAGRLARLAGAPPPMMSDSKVLLDTCLDFLRTPPAENRQWLVVLDALDEIAGGWKSGAGLFPTIPTPHLRVVVAARTSAEMNAAKWLSSLGWQKRHAIILDLPLLPRSSAQQILLNLGAPVDLLSEKPGFVDRLFDLSEGDPLVLRLYVEDLLEKGEASRNLSLADLEHMNPGLEGYFERWFEDQEKIWQSHDPLLREDVWAVIRLCTLAKGGLRFDDFCALVPEQFASAEQIRTAIKYLQRFLDGDGIENGFVFNHPRLAEYFIKHRMTKAEQKTWRKRFLDYGERIISQLINRELLPEETPAYIIRYYGTHLDELGSDAYEELTTLLCHEWLKAWEKLEGTPQGFLDDISRLYPFTQKGVGKQLGQTIHLALCHASVAGLSANIPDELLAQAVAKGAIPLSQGLAYARLKPSANERINALLEIYRAFPDKTTIHLLYEIMDEIKPLDDYSRSNAIVYLAPHLPPDLFSIALHAVMEISNPYDRAKGLAALAPRLPPALLPIALKVAINIFDSDDRAKVLVVLASYLPPDLLFTALQGAMKISNPDSRAWALTALAPHLPVDLLPTAFQAAAELSESTYRTDVLVALAPHLPADLIPAAFQKAMGNFFPDNCARVLAALAPRLPSDLLPAAFQKAMELSFVYFENSALAALSPRLPSDLLSTALQTVMEISELENRSNALAALAPYLPPDLLPIPLRYMKFYTKRVRAEIWAALTPHLPSDLLPIALKAAMEISESEDRSNALAALAPYLPSDLLPTALQAATEIHASKYRARALATLTPHLPPDLLSTALQTATEISELEDRSSALAALAPYLPPDLLSTALQATMKISDPSSRAWALTALAPHLPVDLLPTAFQAAAELSHSNGRAYALVKLTPYLPSDLLPIALKAAMEISESEARSNALAALASYLPPDLLSDAIQATMKISDPDGSAIVLAALAPHLPPDLLPIALQTTTKISIPWFRARALATLAPHLPPGLLSTALQTATEISELEDRSSALAALAPYLPPDLLPTALQAALEISKPSASASALAALIPHLPSDLFPTVFQTAIVSDAVARSEILVALAPYLHADLISIAHKAAMEISYPYFRVLTLAGLAPYTPYDLRPAIRQAVMEFSGSDQHTWALVALAPHLPSDMLPTALRASVLLSDTYDRAKALAHLAPYLPSSLFPTAFQAAMEISKPHNRAKAIAAFAPHLPIKEYQMLVDQAITLLDVQLTSALVPRWEEYCQCRKLDEAQELHQLLWVHRKLTRPKYLKIISAFAPVIHRLGGEQVIRDVVFGIQQTAEWWP